MQQPNSSAKTLEVVQFSDTHFFSSLEGRLLGVDTSVTFEEVRSLASERHETPDFYLFTGDLSQDETPESYLRFARAVGDLPAPAYYVPGNHDIPELMRASFGSYGGPFNPDKVFIKDAWQVILLNTHAEGLVGGQLAASELEKLDRSLQAHPEKFALIVLHHHPVPTGTVWLDTIGLENAAEFLAIVDRHLQVRGVLFGHIHQKLELNRNGVRYMGTPSTCVQFKPKTADFEVDRIPAGYRWLRLASDGGIESEVVRVASVAPGLDFASAGY